MEVSRASKISLCGNNNLGTLAGSRQKSPDAAYQGRQMISGDTLISENKAFLHNAEPSASFGLVSSSMFHTQDHQETSASMRISDINDQINSLSAMESFSQIQGDSKLMDLFNQLVNQIAELKNDIQNAQSPGEYAKTCSNDKESGTPFNLVNASVLHTQDHQQTMEPIHQLQAELKQLKQEFQKTNSFGDSVSSNDKQLTPELLLQQGAQAVEAALDRINKLCDDKKFMQHKGAHNQLQDAQNMARECIGLLWKKYDSFFESSQKNAKISQLAEIYNQLKEAQKTFGACMGQLFEKPEPDLFSESLQLESATKKGPAVKGQQSVSLHSAPPPSTTTSTTNSSALHNKPCAEDQKPACLTPVQPPSPRPDFADTDKTSDIQINTLQNRDQVCTIEDFIAVFSCDAPRLAEDIKVFVETFGISTLEQLKEFVEQQNCDYGQYESLIGKIRDCLQKQESAIVQIDLSKINATFPRPIPSAPLAHEVKHETSGVQINTLQNRDQAFTIKDLINLLKLDMPDLVENIENFIKIFKFNSLEQLEKCIAQKEYDYGMHSDAVEQLGRYLSEQKAAYTPIDLSKSTPLANSQHKVTNKVK